MKLWSYNVDMSMACYHADKPGSPESEAEWSMLAKLVKKSTLQLSTPHVETWVLLIRAPKHFAIVITKLVKTLDTEVWRGENVLLYLHLSLASHMNAFTEPLALQRAHDSNRRFLQWGSCQHQHILP